MPPAMQPHQMHWVITVFFHCVIVPLGQKGLHCQPEKTVFMSLVQKELVKLDGIFLVQAWDIKTRGHLLFKRSVSFQLATQPHCNQGATSV